MANEIEIIVTAKDRGASSTIDGVDRKAEGLRGTLRRVGETAAGFLTGTVLAGAGQKALEFFSDATRGASDLNEAASKATNIFGDFSDGIFEAAETSAQSVGLAKGAFLDFAGTFGNTFTQLGIARGEAARMSDTMIGLASDFSSFHNVDITEVLDAQSAAFRGEYDSVQRFVPLLSAANVEQKAMEQTGKASADQLSAQEKALATYALMLEGAGTAQGDFARTADGAANSERIAAAEMENMQAEIGQKLLPVSRKITEIKLALATAIATRLVPALQKAGEWIQTKVVPAVKDLVAWAQARLLPVLQNLGAWIARNVLPPLAALGRFLVGTIIPALASFVDWLTRNQDVLAAVALGIMGALVPAFVAWAVAAGAAAVATIAAAAPFILLAAAIAAFALLVINHWDTIKAATLAVFNFIKDVISGVIDWISNNWPLLLAILTGPIGLAVMFIVQHWQTIKDAALAAKDWIVARWNDLVSFVTGLPGALAAAAAGIWNWITSGIDAALDYVVGKVINTINTVIRAFNQLPGPDVATIGGGKSGGTVAKRQHGGVSGGWTWLGEHGPELAHLPAGSQVYPAGQSRQMASAAAGPAPVVLQVAPGSMSGLEAMFLEWLRNSIRVEGGGSVQAALGFG